MRRSDSESLAPRRVACALLALGVTLVGCSRDRSPSSATTPADPAEPATPSEYVVNLYNWFEYISPEVLEAFTAETGIHVNLDTFDSAEMLEARLFAGRSGYDVVVTNGNFLERQIASGVFGQLDRGRLPGLANLDPTFKAQMASYDSGNSYAVGYNFGSVGIGYDSRKVAARTGHATVDSWGLVYDPAQASRIADCGITIIDSPTDVLPTVLAYLGKDPNSQIPADLEAAGEVLMGIRPYVRRIDSASIYEDLPGGEVCVVVGWNGLVVGGQERARNLKNGPDLRYVIPREGSIIWFDAFTIPADAPHPEEAHAFIDFMLRPESAARNVSATHYGSVNAKATPLVEPRLRDNPAVYPPAEELSRLVPQRMLSPEATRIVTRIWTRFRTGA